MHMLKVGWIKYVKDRQCNEYFEAKFIASIKSKKVFVYKYCLLVAYFLVTM